MTWSSRRRNGAAPRPARTEARTPTGRCLSAARRAISGLSVVVDARALAAPSFTGTQVLLLELLGALGRNPDVRVRAVVTRNIGEHARIALDQIDGVEVKFLETTGPMERGDVVHRPFQVWNAPDLALLRDLGERLVVTQLDLIAVPQPVLPPIPGRVGALPVADATLPRDRGPRRVLVRPCPPGRQPGRPYRARPRNRRAARRRPPVGADGRCPRTSGSRVTPYGERRVRAVHWHRSPSQESAVRVAVFQQLRARHGWEGWLVMAGPARRVRFVGGGGGFVSGRASRPCIEVPGSRGRLRGREGVAAGRRQSGAIPDALRGIRVCAVRSGESLDALHVGGRHGPERDLARRRGRNCSLERGGDRRCAHRAAP